MMEGMEEKLGAILGNPQMMQQIMSMAQSLGTPPPSQEKPKPQPPQHSIDPGMVQSMMAILQGSGIDNNQRALLKALNPYLTLERLDRLEKAMRAAKLANLASEFLGGAAHV